MNNLLSKLLSKRGIESEEDLSPEEKAFVDNYKAKLSGDSVTVDSLKDFCQQQIKLIENKFASEGGVQNENIYLKACLHVYLNLLKAIEAPEMEREAAERYLNQLIEK